MPVSSAILFASRPPRASTSGKPYGCCSEHSGFGEWRAPGIGLSRAREKVAQLGAQCSMSDSSSC
eukprot:977286-Heterocapsa_arctica.AAC.1